MVVSSGRRVCVRECDQLARIVVFFISHIFQLLVCACVFVGWLSFHVFSFFFFLPAYPVLLPPPPNSLCPACGSPCCAVVDYSSVSVFSSCLLHPWHTATQMEEEAVKRGEIDTPTHMVTGKKIAQVEACRKQRKAARKKNWLMHERERQRLLSSFAGPSSNVLLFVLVFSLLPILAVPCTFFRISFSCFALFFAFIFMSNTNEL